MAPLPKRPQRSWHPQAGQRTPSTSGKRLAPSIAEHQIRSVCTVHSKTPILWRPISGQKVVGERESFALDQGFRAAAHITTRAHDGCHPPLVVRKRFDDQSKSGVWQYSTDSCRRPQAQVRASPSLTIDVRETCLGAATWNLFQGRGSVVSGRPFLPDLMRGVDGSTLEDGGVCGWGLLYARPELS